jgi:hypothetical protein
MCSLFSRCEKVMIRKKVKGKNGGTLTLINQKGAKRTGRPPGKQNVVTTLIKETAMSALAKVGTPRKAFDRKGKFIGWMPTGKGGLEGYFMHVACINEAAMMGLVGKILPSQINLTAVKVVKRVLRSAEEVRAELISRGVPPELIPLRPPKIIEHEP